MLTFILFCIVAASDISNILSAVNVLCQANSEIKGYINIRESPQSTTHDVNESPNHMSTSDPNIINTPAGAGLYNNDGKCHTVYQERMEDTSDVCLDNSERVTKCLTLTSKGSSEQPISDPNVTPVALKSADSVSSSHNTAPDSLSFDDVIKPGLTNSLFPNIPPTINFVAEGEKVEELPLSIRKLMKWRLTVKVTSIFMRCVTRIGFTLTFSDHDWLGSYGVHMEASRFKSIRAYQKFNHFPGSQVLDTKDILSRSLAKLQKKFGKQEFEFVPETYVIPEDITLLEDVFEDGDEKKLWIVKPPDSSRGKGIMVIDSFSEIPTSKRAVVQRYIDRPYLINDLKFHLRIYVHVSSFDPLRLYMYEDGLVRFATMKYSDPIKNKNQLLMHLTNSHVNSKNPDYQTNNDPTAYKGHKWSLKALWTYLKNQGVNTKPLMEKIEDIIIKTIISGEFKINKMTKANCISRYNVHELFGFDIMLDEKLKPWLLEVNACPGLRHDASKIDLVLKDHLVKDFLNIAGVRIPNEDDVVENSTQKSHLFNSSSYRPPNNLTMDLRLFNQQLSNNEKKKHRFYSKKHQDTNLMKSILDTLTPDDIRILTETIDEDSRKGGFQRLFPSSSSHKYLKYFDKPRYYNLLLDQWEQRYFKREDTGISLLRDLCEEKIHLNVNTDNHKQQWTPPNSNKGGPEAVSYPKFQIKTDTRLLKVK